MDQQHSPEEIRELTTRLHELHRRGDESLKEWDKLSSETRAKLEMHVSSKFDEMSEHARELTLHTQILDTLRAGDVRRAHTVPHHGSYTVGGHSWAALGLLFILHPDPSMRLVRALHGHDLGELFLGDLRGDYKWKYREMAEAYEKAENDILVRHFPGTAACLAALTDEERHWLKAIDVLELYLWTSAQAYQGNRYGDEVGMRCMLWFKENPPPKPIEDYLLLFNRR